MHSKAFHHPVFQEGMQAYIQKDYPVSVRRFSDYLDEAPGDPVALTSRGAARLLGGESEKAVADFDASIEIDSTAAKTYHLRGLALEQLGEDDRALADFDRALSLDPEYGAAYNSRAELRNKLGHEQEALEDRQMVAHLTEKHIQEFANDNNVWRSAHLALEEAGIADVMDR